MAEHNIPPELVPVWRRHARLFPHVDTSPDDRAEVFLEWVEENRAELDAELAEAAELEAERLWRERQAEEHAAPF